MSWIPNYLFVRTSTGLIRLSCYVLFCVCWQEIKIQIQISWVGRSTTRLTYTATCNALSHNSTAETSFSLYILNHILPAHSWIIFSLCIINYILTDHSWTIFSLYSHASFLNYILIMYSQLKSHVSQLIYILSNYFNCYWCFALQMLYSLLKECQKTYEEGNYRCKDHFIWFYLIIICNIKHIFPTQVPTF